MVRQSHGQFKSVSSIMQGTETFFLFAGRKKKEEYRERVNEITSQFAKLSEEDAEYRKQEREINEKILLWQRNLRQSEEKQKEIQRKFTGWKMAEAGKISDLEEKSVKYEKIRNDSKIEPLNMNLQYDDLQMSNPWLTKHTGLAQSKLFIMALRVRKQFLFENRKNIKASRYRLGAAGKIPGTEICD